MQSMTGYAHESKEGDWGSASCDIRSLNHRYLEINCRLPDALKPLETEMRSLARSYFHRGRLDVNLTFLPGAQTQGDLMVNRQLASELMEIAAHWRQQTKTAQPMDVMEILKWPGVIISQDHDINAIKAPIMELYETTLKALCQAREKEGKLLAHLIRERWNALKNSAKQAMNRRPALEAQVREKLKNRFEEANITYDTQRFEQEIVYWANKIDVTEEVDRLQAHISQIDQLLDAKNPIGRRVDFLIQEIGREVNTIASKSPDTQMTQCAVAMKTSLEQVREQIQNVE